MYDDEYFSDEAAAKAYRKQEAERAKAEARQNAEVDAAEEAYRKKHKIGPEVKGYQHMIAAEAEEKALRQKAIEELTNKKGTSLNREAARGGSGSGGSGGMGMPKLNRDISKNMKKGGKVSSASKRADGIAMKGKTRGKMC